MNPSYDSSGQNAAGNSGIPGVKPGVIASGPDTPEASVPGVANSLGGLSVGGNSQNPNGVFGRLSRIPGGSRPNSSSSNGFNNGNTGPITPQPIDKIIIDGGGGPKRSKRGLLVAGIALIGVALVVGVVALVVMRGGNGKSSTDIAVAFKTAASYIEFGDANSSFSTSETAVVDTKLYTVALMGTNEQRVEYFDTAAMYLRELKNSIADKNSALMLSTDSLINEMALVRQTSELAYTDILWEVYLENGTNGIWDYTSGIQVGDETYGLGDLGKMVEGFATASNNLYVEYSAANCIRDGEVDADCVNTLVESNTDILNFGEAVSNERLKLRRYTNSMLSIIVDSIVDMSSEIDGTKETNEGANEAASAGVNNE